MKKEKNDRQVKQIIEKYKTNLASLMRKGQAGEVISLLHDSGVINMKDKSMYEIAKISLNATCVEEIEVQRVNFVFSLLSKIEKEIILNLIKSKQYGICYSSYKDKQWNKTNTDDR